MASSRVTKYDSDNANCIRSELERGDDGADVVYALWLWMLYESMVNVYLRVV